MQALGAQPSGAREVLGAACRPPQPSGIARPSLLGRGRRLRCCASSAQEVTLLDYGAGNVRSVRNAIKRLGFSIKEVRPHALPACSSRVP